jgi:hypothetical protein
MGDTHTLSGKIFCCKLGRGKILSNLIDYYLLIGMTFQPGHKLSPGRRHGSRNKRTAEIFHRLEDRGDLDPADLLSTIVTNNEEPKELRIQAAGLLMPYKYSKCGTAPVQVYIDIPLDTPEFTHLSDAEQFLAKVAALVARGELDIQTGLELSTLTKAWIDSQYLREELTIKQINTGTGETEQVIRVTGGLPELPGCSILMPQLNGHALAAPTDAVPQIESAPSAPANESTNGQPPETQAQEPPT